jgi:hypothetical protein
LLQGEGVLRSTTDLEPVDLAVTESAAEHTGQVTPESVREPNIHTDGIPALEAIVRRDHTGPPLQLLTA